MKKYSEMTQEQLIAQLKERDNSEAKAKEDVKVETPKVEKPEKSDKEFSRTEVQEMIEESQTESTEQIKGLKKNLKELTEMVVNKTEQVIESDSKPIDLSDIL